MEELMERVEKKVVAPRGSYFPRCWRSIAAMVMHTS